jgi:hypothetical protein
MVLTSTTASKIEFKKEDIDFIYLFKVVKIDEYKVTFRKYSIGRFMSRIVGYEVIELEEEMGEETHQCTPEVLLKLAGKVGSIIKEFKCGYVSEKKDKIKVIDVVFLCASR